MLKLFVTSFLQTFIGAFHYPKYSVAHFGTSEVQI